MSSYHVKAVNPNHEIYAGWDPMLNTFFAHVIDTTRDEDDEDRDVLWIGCTSNDIHDSEVLFNALKPYTTQVGEPLVTDLYRDANE